MISCENSSEVITPPQDGIIFQTNFNQDTGYFKTQQNLYDRVDTPAGWDGVRVSSNGSFSVQSGEGVSGSNAMRVAWDPLQGQPVANLAKHLTGNRNSGYDEIYVRYNLRLPNRFKAGSDGDGMAHLKFGRLFQMTSPDGSSPGGWTENRIDSGFAVWNFSGKIPFTDANISFAENFGPGLELGSAGGPLQKADYFVSGTTPETGLGYFENLWDLQSLNDPRPGELTDNVNQSWHTIEWRFKLATTDTSDDGIFEMWFDGVNQGQPSRLVAKNGAPNRTGMPTSNRGSGFNFFVFFDNTQGWNNDWSDANIDGFIYANDVVLSQQRIGHNYVVPDQ